MKKISYLVLLIILSFGAVPSFSQNHQQHSAPLDTLKGSPKKMVMAKISGGDIHIEYSSPAVRKRIIWGGLVPYDVVWVTGAHQATSISFSKDVIIENNQIKKGKYGFFTIPGEKEWTLILNKNWNQHLADDYNQEDDILRWKVTAVPNAYTERLTYWINPLSENSGSIEMCWEKIKISFNISE